MDTGKFTLEQCSLLYGIPPGTVAEYIKLSSEFFIAEKKHVFMDQHCLRIGIGRTKEDPRRNYYMSPYHDLKTKGFIQKENIWPRLTIDEVNLWDQVYTILGNPEKNKIIACIPGIKSSIVTEAIRNEISFEERLNIREVTLDMSPTMDHIVNELFPQAKRTLDRFHVTTNVLEDIQSIRMRIKTLIKSEELEKEEQ